MSKVTKRKNRNWAEERRRAEQEREQEYERRMRYWREKDRAELREEQRQITVYEINGRPYFLAARVFRVFELDKGKSGLLDPAEISFLEEIDGLPCYRPEMLISVKALCQLAMLSTSIAAEKLKAIMMQMGPSVLTKSCTGWQLIMRDLAPKQATVANSEAITCAISC